MPAFSSKTTHLEHGVFVAVKDVGVLIRGPAGIGKSSLALELLDRGHALISDDVVQFEVHPVQNKVDSVKIIGSAPPMLQDLLAVRDIGVLDITEIFSNSAIIPAHRLDFIIQLDAERTPNRSDFTDLYAHSPLLGHKIPSQTIFAHPSRNIALIVETALKNYILYKNGQDAGRKLSVRQQQYL